MTLVLPPHLIPSSHPLPPHTFGQEQGSKAAGVREEHPTHTQVVPGPPWPGCGYASWLFPIDFSDLAASK